MGKECIYQCIYHFLISYKMQGHLFLIHSDMQAICSTSKDNTKCNSL